MDGEGVRVSNAVDTVGEGRGAEAGEALGRKRAKGVDEKKRFRGGRHVVEKSRVMPLKSLETRKLCSS